MRLKFDRLGLVGLGLIFFASASVIFIRSGSFHEFPWGCDPFGYLQEAQMFRQAVDNGQLPTFTLDSSQQTQAIEVLKASGLPLSEWESGVGPHSTHFYSGSGKIGIQYAPGTGAMLSLFPEGNAVTWINRILIAILSFGIFLWFSRLFRARAWKSAGMLTLCGFLGLDILRRVGDTSFSVQCSLVLLCASLLLAEEEAWRGGSRVLTGTVSALLGFSVLVRLPLIFLYPGFLARSLSKPKKLLVWMSGVAIFGIVPVLLFQATLTGSPFKTTYGSADTHWVQMDRIFSNLDFYLGSGSGAVYNWVGLVTGLGFVGVLLARSSEDRRRLFMESGFPSLLIMILPALYFVFHEARAHYYLIPSVFASSLCLALGAARVEACKPSAQGLVARNRAHTSWARWSFALALIPGLVAGGWAGSTQFLSRKQFYLPGAAERNSEFPRKLLDPKAWVYSELYGGTLWYFEKKPSFKLSALSNSARLALAQNVYDRGEPQYFVDDAEESQLEPIRAQVKSWGGDLVQEGRFETRSFYRFVWSRRPSSI